MWSSNNSSGGGSTGGGDGDAGANTYTITWNLNGGTLLNTYDITLDENKIYKKGVEKFLPESHLITKKHYTFKGWSITKAGNTDPEKDDKGEVKYYTKITTDFECSLTVTACFEVNSNTILYILNNANAEWKPDFTLVTKYDYAETGTIDLPTIANI